MTSTFSPQASPPPAAPISVVVAGALGRMGAEVVKAVRDAADCSLVGAIDTTPGKEGADVGLELGLGELEVAITADFEGTLCQASQAVRNAGPGGGGPGVPNSRRRPRCEALRERPTPNSNASSWKRFL